MLESAVLTSVLNGAVRLNGKQFVGRVFAFLGKLLIVAQSMKCKMYPFCTL